MKTWQWLALAVWAGLLASVVYGIAQAWGVDPRLWGIVAIYLGGLAFLIPYSQWINREEVEQ